MTTITTYEFLATWLRARFAEEPKPQCTADWFDSGQGMFFGHISGCSIHGCDIGEADNALDRERYPKAPRSIPGN